MLLFSLVFGPLARANVMMHANDYKKYKNNKTEIYMCAPKKYNTFAVCICIFNVNTRKHYENAIKIYL